VSHVLGSDVAVASDDEESGADQKYSITVEKNQILYTSLVDNIGNVSVLLDKGMDNVPPNLDPQFRNKASGVYRLKGELLAVFEVDKALELLIEFG
tara:strand:+ start:101 stop:388 length:288 start_codon:yes stop_codon:yes gene_type:complete